MKWGGSRSFIKMVSVYSMDQYRSVRVDTTQRLGGWIVGWLVGKWMAYEVGG